MPLPPLYDRAACRAEVGLPGEGVLFGVAGTIDPTKEPALSLNAFARVREQVPGAYLVFAGERPADYGLNQLIRELRPHDQVIFLGRVEPLERLHRAIAACDVMINLRSPTIGETSGTALRTLSLGRALIVRGVGWYDELPNEVCVKIGPLDQVEALAEAMLILARSPAYRAQLAEAGRHYIQTECNVATVAQRYNAFGHNVCNRIEFH